MAKHKCGSCHFFQEARLAGSGWCHHPQRKVSSDVLIMVRRNELACRDEWSRSLWQPREGQHTNGDAPFQRPVPAPLPPTLAENLRSVLNHDMTEGGSSQGEDVLLSEGRILSEARESWEPEHRPFPVGNFDPRTAIFRAREAYRERVRAKSAAERQSAGAEAVIASQPSEDIAPTAAQQLEVEPAQHRLQAASAAANGGLALQTPDVNSQFTDPREMESIVTEPALPAGAGKINERILNRPPGTISEAQASEPEAVERVAAAPDERVSVPTPRTPDFTDADSARAHLDSAEKEALPDWYRRDLPRTCRTCRDYRPSADGQRGWCANSWAFTHRRLVLEEDPAPCQSAIGDWWLPVDDVWLVAADVSSHGRATPLLDRLTGKSDQQRRRS